MTKPKHIIVWWLLAGLAALSGCAGARILEAWQDETVGPLRFQKTAVLVIDPSQTRRRTGEDEIIRRLPPGMAVPGYRIFEEAEPGDFDRVSGRLREAGFDGAVVVRVLAVEDRLHWVPGYPVLLPPYRSHYFRGPFWYDSGYYRTDQIIRVEIAVHSLPLNKLVWTGVTESFNPASPAALMADVAEAVVGELQKQGRFLFQ